MLTQIISWVYKASLTLRYPPNIDIWLILHIWYLWVGPLIALLIVLIDTMHSPIYRPNIGIFVMEQTTYSMHGFSWCPCSEFRSLKGNVYLARRGKLLEVNFNISESDNFMSFQGEFNKSYHTKFKCTVWRVICSHYVVYHFVLYFSEVWFERNLENRSDFTSSQVELLHCFVKDITVLLLTFDIPMCRY